VVGALSVSVIAAGVGNLRVVRTVLSMPSVSNAVTLYATDVIATPHSLASQASPDGRRATPATPVRVRTAERTRSGLEQSGERPVIGLPVGPVPEAETSPPTGTTLRLASLPPAAAMPTAITPLAPPSAQGTVAPTSPEGSATNGDAARAPWSAAADAGKAVGRGSRDAATAAGRFFTRFGKTVAGSF
jgi:hypothetical protein